MGHQRLSHISCRTPYQPTPCFEERPTQPLWKVYHQRLYADYAQFACRGCCVRGKAVWPCTSRTFCLLEDRELLMGNITVMYIGEVGPSTWPLVHASFCRGGHGHVDAPGGGAGLQAMYHVVVPRTGCRRWYTSLKETCNDLICTDLLYEHFGWN